MTRDELRDKVARAIHSLYGFSSWEDAGEREEALMCADAAVAVALEEAARVAEAFPAHTHGNLATAPPQAAEQAADEIAAAIRALIPVNHLDVDKASTS